MVPRAPVGGIWTFSPHPGYAITSRFEEELLQGATPREVTDTCTSRVTVTTPWEGLQREVRRADEAVLELHIQFRPEKKAKGEEEEKEQKLTACCGKFDLTDYINAWESLPPLKPPVAIDLPVGEVQIDEIDPEPPQA
jgi:hypothetical protein